MSSDPSMKADFLVAFLDVILNIFQQIYSLLMSFKIGNIPFLSVVIGASGLMLLMTIIHNASTRG